MECHPVKQDWKDAAGILILYGLAIVSILALAMPTLVVVITSFDTRAFIGFPPAGFSLDRYLQIFKSRAILQSAYTSLWAALLTVSIDLVLGVPAAIALGRSNLKGRLVLTSLLLSPIMLPGLVIGIAVLMFYSSVGWRISIPLLIVAHVVFTLPFVIRLTLAAMEKLDPSLEEAARNLGAGTWQVFRHVLLPQLKSGIVAGAAFAFLNSFDNLTLSLFLAPVRSRTLPVELFYRMRFNLDPVVSAVAAFQFVFAFLLLAILQRRAGSRGLPAGF